jgi:uncharacterized protein (DUF983 family)
MIFGVIIDFAVGLLLAALGLLLWKKQKVSLLHDYHYQHVKKEDLPAYTRQMGIGLIVIGAGICGAGLLNLASSPYWWVSLLAGFTLGIFLLFRAQKKYNGSVMG